MVAGALNAQSPLYYAYATVSNKTLISPNVYNVTLVGFNGGYREYPNSNFEEVDVPASPTDFVVWGSCVRFRVVSRISTVPFVLQVQDLISSGAFDGSDLIGTKVEILQEAKINGRPVGANGNIADGNAGSQTGVGPFEGSCRQNFYAKQLDTALMNVGGVLADNGLSVVSNKVGFGSTTPLNRNAVIYATGFPFAVHNPTQFQVDSATSVNLATDGGAKNNKVQITNGVGGLNMTYDVLAGATAGSYSISSEGIRMQAPGGGKTFIVTDSLRQGLDFVHEVPVLVDEAGTLAIEYHKLDSNSLKTLGVALTNLSGGSAPVAGQVPVWNGTQFVMGSPSSTTRYSAGNGAWVLATGTGVTFTRTTASVWTFNIPSGVELLSFDINSTISESSTSALDLFFVFAGTRTYDQDISDNMLNASIPNITTLKKVPPAQYPTTAASNNAAWVADVTVAGTLKISTSEFSEVSGTGSVATSIKGTF